MIKGKDWADSTAQYQDLGERDLSLEPLSLATNSVFSLSEIKSLLVKVAEFEGSTFLITNENSKVSIFLHQAPIALKLNSIEIDSGIQTLKSTEDDIVIISSTGQEYSLIKSIEKVDKGSANKRSKGLKRAAKSKEGLYLAS